MRNWQQLAKGENTIGLLQALARQPELWNAHRLRTTHPASPHTQVDDIWLRFNDVNEPNGELTEQTFAKVLDEHESVNYPAYWLLPQARGIIFGLMRLVEGERLGRVLITRLGPGKVIPPHVDTGNHAAYYDRYQLALDVRAGVQFRCGNEYCPMVTGDVWWFNNGIEHEVVNNSADDRLVMIVDIRTPRRVST